MAGQVSHHKNGIAHLVNYDDTHCIVGRPSNFVLGVAVCVCT